jgi:hypothetical protein
LEAVREYRENSDSTLANLSIKLDDISVKVNWKYACYDSNNGIRLTELASSRKDFYVKRIIYNNKIIRVSCVEINTIIDERKSFNEQKNF